jgi:hypothetical protein
MACQYQCQGFALIDGIAHSKCGIALVAAPISA